MLPELQNAVVCSPIRRQCAVRAVADAPQRIEGSGGSSNAPPGSVQVRVDNDADADSTVLHMEADSRPGLLTALTGSFRDLGLEIVRAIIGGSNGRVSNTFYVQDADGVKVTDVGTVQNVKRSLEVSGPCPERAQCWRCMPLDVCIGCQSRAIRSRDVCALQAVLKAKPGKGITKRPNLLMTAGIGLTERDDKKEHLYGLMGAASQPFCLCCSLCNTKYLCCSLASAMSPTLLSFAVRCWPRHLHQE